MRPKRNRINTVVIMVLTVGDITLPRDKTLEASEQDLPQCLGCTSTL